MPKRRTKRFLFAALLLIVVIGVTLVAIWANQPVVSTPPSTAVEGATTEKTYQPLSSNLFSTFVPSTLTIKSQDLAGHGSVLNQLFLTSNQGTPGNPIADQLAITVGVLPSDGLEGLSDVDFRRLRAETYKPETNLFLGEDSLQFVKTDSGYEKSVFWSHNGYFAAVVVSGTVDRSDYLNNDLDGVIHSWEWLVE